MNCRQTLHASEIHSCSRVQMILSLFNAGAGRGRMFIGDVGESWMEEIDILEARGNFGWSAREATDCYKENCGFIGKWRCFVKLSGILLD